MNIVHCLKSHLGFVPDILKTINRLPLVRGSTDFLLVPFEYLQLAYYSSSSIAVKMIIQAAGFDLMTWNHDFARWNIYMRYGYLLEKAIDMKT